jgi:tetratricopeptide (TPR) repeat protein
MNMLRKTLSLLGTGLLYLALTAHTLAQTPAPATEPAWQKNGTFQRSASLPEQAAKAEADGQLLRAAKIYGKMATLATRNENRAFALVRRGDCLYTASKFKDSYRAYEKALNDTAFYVSLENVLERVRSLAEAFAKGEGVFFASSGTALAIQAHELILKVSPVGEQASQDRLKLAELYRENGNRDEARLTYREIIRRGPATPAAGRARLELGKLLLAEARVADADGELVRQADRELKTFLGQAATEANRNEVEALLRETAEIQATRLLELGQFYNQPAQLRLTAARRYLNDVNNRYPGTDAARKAASILTGLDAIPAAEPPAQPVATQPADASVAPMETILKESVQTPDAQTTPVNQQPLYIPENTDDAQPKKWLLPLYDLNEEGK